jgi:hypothetical protein
MNEKELLKEIHQYCVESSTFSDDFNSAQINECIQSESKNILLIFSKHNYNAEAPDERDLLLQRIKKVAAEAHENRMPVARLELPEKIIELFLESSYQIKENKQ